MIQTHEMALDFAVDQVRRLAVGQAVVVSSRSLWEARRDGVRWAPEDLVLERILGASFEFTADPQFPDGILFRRWPECPEGRWRWVSPDRRHLFERTPDGLWRMTWAACQDLAPRVGRRRLPT